MSGELQDKDFLFTMLTSLIKKNNGEIIISEKDIEKVEKSDIVIMLHDQPNENFIFKLNTNELKFSSDKSFGSMEKEKINYEN